jgi:DMSO/TMAO reductase YedYZ heme-binding membrane subunit
MERCFSKREHENDPNDGRRMNEMNVTEILDHICEYLYAYLWIGVPVVVQGLIVAFVFAVFLRKPIKAHPIVFYIYPVLLLLWRIFSDIATSLPGNPYEQMGLNESLIPSILYLFGVLGFDTSFGIGLLIIVMFIGVLPKTTLVKNLYGIRTEMSVIGATILVAHTVLYWGEATYYIPEQYAPLILMYRILGPALLILILIPWITSFRIVRKKMKATTWKKLQTYLGVPLFIGMLVFGLGLNVAWSAGDRPGFVDIWEITTSSNGEYPISLGDGINFGNFWVAAKVYGFLLVSYIILRIKKVRNASRSRANLPEEPRAAL